MLVYTGTIWRKELEELLDNFKDHENRFVVSSSYVEGSFKAPMMTWATLDEIINIGKEQILKIANYLSKVNN